MASSQAVLQRQCANGEPPRAGGGCAVTQADGRAERETALRMLQRHRSDRRRTVAADKGYDTHDCVGGCRALRVTPHVAQNTTAAGQRDRRPQRTRHPATRSVNGSASGWKRSSAG